MKHNSPPTDNPATRTAAKAQRLRDVAADPGAARRVRNWCTAPVNVRTVATCADPPSFDGERDD